MVEKGRRNLDQGGTLGALFTDLSKDFVCLIHDFLLAKLEAYGFTYESLKPINSYLNDRKHRTKVNSSDSLFLDLLIEVPQGSILGLLLFNIDIFDLFLFLEEDNVTRYADEPTPCAMKKNFLKILQVLKEIEYDAALVFNWFSAKKRFFIGLLSINIYNFLTFNEHTSNLCKKPNQKLQAITRISSYLHENKLRLKMNAFFSSQFGYCPLVWMFDNRRYNDKIHRLHERMLRIVYIDCKSAFAELLKINHLQYTTEMFKS